MSKRVVIAVGLIAAALALSCATLGKVKNVGQTLIGYLEEAEALHAENGDYAAPLDKALQLWSDKRELLGVILKHSDTDEIEKYFYQISTFRENGAAADLFAAVEECRAAIEVMLRGEDPAARNIF